MKGRTGQVRTSQIGIFPINITQPGIREICPSHVSTMQLRTTQNGISQFRMRQHNTLPADAFQKRIPE